MLTAVCVSCGGSVMVLASSAYLWNWLANCKWWSRSASRSWKKVHILFVFILGEIHSYQLQLWVSHYILLTNLLLQATLVHVVAHWQLILSSNKNKNSKSTNIFHIYEYWPITLFSLRIFYLSCVDHDQFTNITGITRFRFPSQIKATIDSYSLPNCHAIFFSFANLSMHYYTKVVVLFPSSGLGNAN